MKDNLLNFINNEHEKISDKLDVFKISLADSYLDEERQHLLTKYKEHCSVCKAQLDTLEHIKDFILKAKTS